MRCLHRLARTYVVSVVLVLAARAQDAANDLAGHWKGSIDVFGQPLAIDVDFAREGESWRGDISIPAQRLVDGPLSIETLDVGDARFEIAGVPGAPRFEGKLDAEGKLAGAFTQGGQKLTFVLERGRSRAELAREALAGFDEFVEASLEKWKVPGASVGIFAGGEIVMAKGFGLRDVEAKLPVTERTLFPIGSSTKAITAFVLSTLVAEGKLAWDEPVVKFAPRFALKDRARTDRMLVRDLLTHGSGYPRHDLVWSGSAATRDELVARLAFLEPVADLRAEWNYNNLMYVTAGWLAEQVTSKSWEDCVRERVFAPLAMRDSGFSTAVLETTADHARGYAEVKRKIAPKPYRETATVGPCGSIHSNVVEMLAWVRANLGDERASASGDFDVSAELHAPRMTIQGGSDRPDIGPTSYALGWFVEPYRGHQRLHHGGNIDGFSALVSFLPADGLGLVVLTNKDSTGVPELLMRHAIDRVLGLPPVEWSESALRMREVALAASDAAATKKDVARKSGTQPAHALVDYAGTYFDPGYGRLEVALEGEGLALVFGGARTALEHWHFETWNAAPAKGSDSLLAGTKLLFVTNVRGDVEAVRIALEPRVADIVFAKEADARTKDPAYLAALSGEYDLAGAVIRVDLSAGKLRVTVPGQPTYTLVPKAYDEFELAEAPIFRVRFGRDADDAVSTLTFDQPNGVFEAKRR